MTVVVQDLIELAERCEKATGSDRELDALIWRAIEPDYKHRKASPHQAPDYTGSFDAAMTLARNNREAMLMIHVAFRSFESENMDDAPDLFPCIKFMLAENLRQRARASIKGEG